MSAQKTAYMAYLLRLWRARDGERPGWRASLENVRTGERRGFRSVEELLAFIKEVTMEDTNTDAELIHE